MIRKKEVPAFVERRRARERWATLAKMEAQMEDARQRKAIQSMDARFRSWRPLF